MWIKTPKQVKALAWDGPLEPEGLLSDEGERRGDARGVDRSDTKDFPSVSVGVPNTWAIRELYSNSKLPQSFKSKMAKNDFYLSQLFCSFRPKHGGPSIEWARFAVELLPDADGRMPLAYDLFPRLVAQELRRNVKVAFSPSIKFHELEGKAGDLSFGLEYTELQPVISAAGLGEAKPSWDYETARGVKVQGGKVMYLLAQAPKGMAAATARLTLVADVATGSGLFRSVLGHSKREAAAPVLVQLWG
jgi:hypothetical protein